MMYGENSGRLREHLATLLNQYRVNYHLLREVSRTRSTLTIEARQIEAGAQVRRYRQTILAWCDQTMLHADPNPKSDKGSGPFDPLDRIRQAVHRIATRSASPLPTMDELTTPQQVTILETWRQAAKAATQAERDFTSGLGQGLLGHRERLTLAGDMADITKALLILDKRYQNLPGWEPLRGFRGIDQYIADLADQLRTSYGKADYNIDWRGWHPPDPEIAPDAPVITRVLAAEHRLLNALTTVPSMINLRHLISSQRELSHLAADRARDIAPEQAARFRHRERGYATLGRASRSAAGLAGTGAAATRHSADAARTLVTIPVGEPVSPEAFRNLDKLFRHVDNRLAAAIEQGFNTRIYLVRATLPRIDPTDGALAHQAREIFEPLQREGRTPLIAVARRYLRTDPVAMVPPGSAAITRADFRSAINHRQSGSDGLSL